MSLKNIKLKTPEYNDTLPSTKAAVKFRPFTVAEEKLLLIASESKDNKQIADSMRKIINNCTGLDSNNITYYDIEYLFTKIRAKSVGEVTFVKFNCSHCEHENEVEIELDKVDIARTEGHSNTIKIEDNLIFIMKEPQLEILSLYDDNKNSVDNTLEIIANSLKTVQVDDEVIEVNPSEVKEAINLIEQLTSDQFKKINSFFDTMPKTFIDINYNCSNCSELVEQRLEGMHNFF